MGKLADAVSEIPVDRLSLRTSARCSLTGATRCVGALAPAWPRTAPPRFKLARQYQRRGQTEIDDSFRGNLDLLAVGEELETCARATAGGCADASAFTPTGETADERSCGSTDAGANGGLLAAPGTFSFIGAGGDGHLGAVVADADKA